MVQYDKLAAEDVKIAIITQQDKQNNKLPNANKWINIEYWGGMPSKTEDGDLKQVLTTPDDNIINLEDQHLYLLLEYISPYSKMKYKHLYEWCITKTSEKDTMNFQEYNYSYNHSYNFSEKDFYKSDFNQVLFEEYKQEHASKKNNSTATTNLDEEMRLKQQFMKENDMIDEIQTKIKHNFIKLSFNRPVFLESVCLVKATSIRKPCSITQHFKKKRRINTIDDWLNIY